MTNTDTDTDMDMDMDMATTIYNIQYTIHDIRIHEYTNTRIHEYTIQAGTCTASHHPSHRAPKEHGSVLYAHST